MNSKEYVFDVLAKIGFVLLVNLVGFACMLGVYSAASAAFNNISMGAFAVVWCLLGASAAIYWPMKFRENLEKDEITDILKMSLPLAPALGPISFIACRPL